MLFLNFCTIPEPEQIITQSLFMHEDIMYSQNTLVKSQRLQILPLLPSNLYLGTISNNEFMRGLRFKLYLWLWYCEINILFSEDVNGLWTHEWQHSNQQFKVWWSLLEKFHFRTSPIKYLLWSSYKDMISKKFIMNRESALWISTTDLLPPTWTPQKRVET